jgi:uncharacterized membrane protein YidH (DUF202 family)
MKRSLGGFLILVGILVSTYAFSAYNLYTASDPATHLAPSTAHPVFYLFFAMAVVSVIAGINIIKTDENATH